MSSDTTLFAHIAPRLTDRTEDVAVDALGHILSQSEAARGALENTLREGGAAVNSIVRVRTQAIGGEGERPDLAGLDDDGVEGVLIEAKFWAGLTQNQPNGYLRRLPVDRPAALLFVAPAARLETLWPELCRRAGEKFTIIGATTPGDLRTATVSGGERRLMLTSWAALLDLMATKANSAADRATESDISQLRGLTDRMDAEAFLPWRSEDLGPEFARRVLGLITLIDEATDRGCAVGFLDIGRMMKSPRYEGYGRHMKIGGVAAWFGFIMDGWAVHGTTPLWLLFTNDMHKQLQDARLTDTKVVKWRTGDERYCIPIELPTGVEYDVVLDSVVDSLKRIADQLMASGT